MKGGLHYRGVREYFIQRKAMVKAQRSLPWLTSLMIEYLYLIAVVPNPTTCKVHRIFNKCSKQQHSGVVNKMVRDLDSRGLIVYNGRGKLRITAAGENLLATFEKMIRDERWDR